MKRRIHMQDQVKNRVAAIMDDSHSDATAALASKLLVIAGILLIGVVW